MSTFGQDLLKAMAEAAEIAEGKRAPAAAHRVVTAKDVRKRQKLTQKKMAQLMNMSLSGYRKMERGERALGGPAQNLLRVIDKNPEAVIEALRE